MGLERLSWQLQALFVDQFVSLATSSARSSTKKATGILLEEMRKYVGCRNSAASQLVAFKRVIRLIRVYKTEARALSLLQCVHIVITVVSRGNGST